MARTKTTAVKTAQACNCPEEAFSAESLNALLDKYAQPVAREAIRQMLPDRVKFHINRLLTSDNEADRQELLEIMKGAKLNICFAVYHSVLSYAREASEAALSGSDQQSLPSASSNSSEAA